MRQVYQIVLLSSAVLYASLAFGQTEQKVAPTAPSSETPDKATPNSTAQGPANLCEELGAYAKTQEEKQQQASQQNPVSAPAPNSPKGDEKADKPQQDSGITKPVPNDAAKAGPKVALEELRLIAERNDRDTCRTTVNTLRRAGTALPPALIALAAMKTGR
jgi:hypothetical protein